jgi:hypothetical protein
LQIPQFAYCSLLRIMQLSVSTTGDGHMNPVAQKFFRDVVLPYAGTECLIWPFAIDAKGYGRMHHEGRNVRVSRLVCLMIHGAPPAGRNFAAHSCGKGSSGCVAPRHMSWKTPKENLDDAVAHGTAAIGEKNPSAKLTAAQAREIYQSSADRVDLALLYGVSTSTISGIRNGRFWRSVTAA